MYSKAVISYSHLISKITKFLGTARAFGQRAQLPVFWGNVLDDPHLNGATYPSPGSLFRAGDGLCGRGRRVGK